VQKRNYLRRHARGADAETGLGRGFLLERARLLVVPVGIDAAVHMLEGCSLCESAAALDLGRQIIKRLREVLNQDGRHTNVDSCIDGTTTVAGNSLGMFFLEAGPANLLTEPWETTIARVAGLTPWSPTVPSRSQLRAAGALHSAAEAGTAAVFLADGAAREPEAVADLLHFAWRHTDVVRLKFICPRPQQQPTFLAT
jgi:hypothetical protein